jgi:lipopolysaccharide export LptBFGC system permease protein LptF
MLYTIAEISNITKLSKVTIYKHLKLKDMEKYKSKKKGVTYISEEGFSLIKNRLSAYINDLDNTESNNSNYSPSNEMAMDKETLNTKDIALKALINQLKVKDLQLSKKNIQIQDLNNRLSQEQDLHKNTQILFKQQQPQQILQLEEHFEELDNKLIEIKDKMLKKDQGHKGLLQKIFKKGHK